jgi:hypothetical protein
LIHVTDIDQDGICILPTPSTDLSNATRQSTSVRVSVVIRHRQNVVVKIGRVQDRDANGVGIQRRNRVRQIWNRTDQPSSASELQKIASRPGFILTEHWGNSFAR